MKPQRREDRAQRRRPLGVAESVRVQQVGELAWLGVAVLVGEQRPRVERDDLRVVLDRGAAYSALTFLI